MPSSPVTMHTTTAAILPLQSGPGDDHPDTSGDNTVVVVGGAAQAGVIGVADDVDRFRVELSAGSTYRFELTSANGGLAYSELALLSGSGSKIAKDSGGGKNGIAQISYTALTSGTYYLDAMGPTGNTGAYTVSAIQTASPPVTPNPVTNDDYPATNDTTGVVAPNGTAVQGQLERVGDVDYFKVALEGNATYTFSLQGSGALQDTFLRLRAEDGRVLASDDDGSGSKNGGSRITVVAPSSGTYYLDVSSDVSQSGAYALQAVRTATPPVTPPQPDPVKTDDYPDSTATTGFLTVNGAGTRGVLEKPYDADWLRVDLQAGVLYQLDVEGAPSNTGGTALASPAVSLRTADGIMLSTGGKGSAERVSFVAPADGTYYVNVQARDNTSTGTYAVKATTLPDDQPSSPATTGLVQVNGNATIGRIDAPSDADYFKVQLAAGTWYGFALTGTDGTGSLVDTFLRLRDADGKELGSNDDAAGGSKNSNSVLKFQAQASGTYYLEASGDGNLVGGYTLSALSALTITEATPANGAVNVARSANLVLTLDRPVQSNHGMVMLLEPGVGAWQISVDDASQVRIDGKTITINPLADLRPDTNYSIYFSEGALKDANGHVLDGLTHGSEGELSFTTVVANRAPTAANLTVQAAPGLPLAGRLPSAMDADGDSVWYQIQEQPLQGGRLSVEADGSYTYEAPYWFTGTDQFRFSLLDSQGATNVYTGTVNVVPLPAVKGSPEADTLAAATGSHHYAGLDGNDRISTGPGPDVVDGGGGTDTLVLTVPRSGATLQHRFDGGWTVTSAASGTDQVFDVERVQFTDISTTLGILGSVAQVARVIGAVFGTAQLHDAALVGRYLALADSGVGGDLLVHRALAEPLFASLAGSLSNADVITHVYTNLVGKAPSAEEVGYYGSLITSGQYTQDTLLWWASNLDLTAQRIDLNGLADHGLDFLPVAGT